MVSDIPTAAEFPTGSSRYTQAMAKCLRSAGQPLGRSTVHTLINLVQGRMLEYLADRICREYSIEDPVARQRIVDVLLGIFSDEFFAVFRHKVELQPQLVAEIARRIVRKESGADARVRPGAPDRLYPAIFRRYFEYRHPAHLLEVVESDVEIQKIILRTLLQRRVGDPQQRRRILDLLEADSDGVAPSLFLDYVKQDKLSLLFDKVESGEWQTEMEHLRRRMAHLRGE